MKKCFASLLAMGLFLSSTGIAQTLNTLEFDITAPSITHEAPADSGNAGELQTIMATITDNVVVKNATVHFLRSSADQYREAPMAVNTTATSWMATIDTSPDDRYVLYFIVAEDQEGNRVQKGAKTNPLRIELNTDQQFVNATVASGDSTTQEAGQTEIPHWMMIGLGILALGLLAGSSGGDGEPSGPLQSDDTCCTVTFTVDGVGSN